MVCANLAVAQPLIVLDAGHEPSHPGAIGTCGIREDIYNDELVKVLAKNLSKSYRVKLTREYGKEVNVDVRDLVDHIPAAERSKWAQHKSLYGRPATANMEKADIIISIHHDSNSLKQQINNPELCHGKGGVTVKAEFKQKYKIGFNVFINDDSHAENQQQSLVLAKLIGQRLVKIGRQPSNYHVYPDDDCKSCRPIENRIGVWHNNLAVLRNSNMPAVLIEAGNIVDSHDESIVNNHQYRTQFSLAVKSAIDDYFKKLSD